METLQTIPKTDLARKTRQVLQAVQRGQTTIIESHGQPEAAIMDIVDYRIIRAVLRYHSQNPEITPESGLSDSVVAQVVETQARFDLVLAHYLGGAISLGRASELLDIVWIDLRFRFNRLDVPILTSPESLEDARAEVDAILSQKR